MQYIMKVESTRDITLTLESLLDYGFYRSENKDRIHAAQYIWNQLSDSNKDCVEDDLLSRHIEILEEENDDNL